MELLRHLLLLLIIGSAQSQTNSATGTTESPTTSVPTTSSTTESPTTPEPTTTGTTESPTIPEPPTTDTTESPTTPEPTTTGTTESPTTPGPITSSTTESPTTPEAPTSSTTESPTTPEPTTTGTTESPTTPEPTTTGTTESPTTPEPTTTGITESPTTPEPTTAITTESPTTPEPTTAGTTESPTTPGPTTTGTTELPTTPGPTTASITESPTTTTQNRVVANVPLSFSAVGNFEPSLNNRSSRNFRSLAASITTGLDAVYRPDPNYLRAIVNNFRNGSIIANCTLEYGNTTPPPTGSEVERQLVNSLANGTDLGNVTLIPGTISSGDSAQSQFSSTTGTTELPTTPEPTTTGTIESPTTPEPTTTGTTESPTTSGPTTASTTESPTTTTQNRIVANVPLSFSVFGNFEPSLNNRSSRNFRSLAASITTGRYNEKLLLRAIQSSERQYMMAGDMATQNLDAVYRPDPNYLRAIVNNFRNGSIIANCTLEYGNTTPPPTGSEVERQLVNSLANGTDLGNVTLIPGTISSGDSAQSQFSSTTGTTELPTTPEPTTTGTIESPTTPEPTTTGTTESPTTSGPTTASTTESPTTTTQNRIVANVPLSFSVFGNFEPSLNNRSSRNFRSLAASITTGRYNEKLLLRAIQLSERQYMMAGDMATQNLDAVYRPDPNYLRAIVNNFRNGSIIANCTLEYENTTTPPTESEVVRQLVNSLANGTDLGNVTLIPGTISSGGTTLDNLQPISLSISYVIENMAFTNTLNNMSSTEFINLRSSVINWLKPVLTSVFGARTTSNYNVSFSNVTTMVQVSTNVQINTTNFANATMLRDLLIQNVTDSGFDIVISSIRVDGLALTTQSFPLQLRFTTLNFTNDLTMRGSARFNGLSANITNVVNNIYMNNPNFVDIVVNEFRSGSVMSSTTISVQPNTISQAEAAQTLANNTAQFASAGLRLDVNALTNTTTTPTTEGTTTTTAGTTTTTAGTTITTAGTTITTTGPTVNQPTPTQPFPSYAIAIIVIGVLLLIAVPFVIVLCVKTGYCSKVEKAFRLESPEISDTRLPMFEGQSHNFN